MANASESMQHETIETCQVLRLQKLKTHSERATTKAVPDLNNLQKFVRIIRLQTYVCMYVCVYVFVVIIKSKQCTGQEKKKLWEDQYLREGDNLIP